MSPANLAGAVAATAAALLILLIQGGDEIRTPYLVIVCMLTFVMVVASVACFGLWLAGA